MLSAVRGFAQSVVRGPTQSSVRSFHSSKPRFGLDEFFTNQSSGKTGRAWSAAELRLKSFEDLQKLWFVLLKEKNMLATYKNLCRQNNIVMMNPERSGKVRDSMAAIKQVVGERSRLYKEFGKYISYIFVNHTASNVGAWARSHSVLLLLRCCLRFFFYFSFLSS